MHSEGSESEGAILAMAGRRVLVSDSPAHRYGEGTEGEYSHEDDLDFDPVSVEYLHAGFTMPTFEVYMPNNP